MNLKRLDKKFYFIFFAFIFSILLFTLVNAQSISLQRIYPLNDITVNRSSFFNVTVNVSCLGSDCGQINVTLDPPGNPVSCKEILDLGYTTDGIYTIYPNSSTGFEVYCDLNTDGGGWTLVSSISTNTLDDKNGSWHNNLTTLKPTNTTADWIWGGLRGLVRSTAINNTEDDIRFSCKTSNTNDTMAVDLAFYDIGWYYRLTNSSSEANVCFEENNGASDTQPTPARKNLLNNTSLSLNDQWNSGYLEGEDSCSDSGDFSVDFDDRGMDSNQGDGTDWGEDDSSRKCATTTPSSGAWFIWFREGVNYTSKSTIPTITGATPFYTNITNPYNLTLNNGDSRIITWFVNATGGPTNYTFFVYANITSNYSIGNMTTNWTVTIYQDLTPPSLNITYPLNITYDSLINSFNYTVSDINGLLSCSYSLNNGVTNTTIACGTNVTDLSSNEGNNLLSVYAIDNFNNLNTSRVNFTVDTLFPQISFGNRVLENNTFLPTGSIYANVSVNESTLRTITFTLFNSTGLVNRTVYSTAIYALNWTLLRNGTYYYNVTINDSLGRSNYTQTRTITLDTIRPYSALLNPANGSSSTISSVYFGARFNDSFGLKNASLRIWNSSMALINLTNFEISGNSNSSNISFNLPYSGTFHWNYFAYDLAGNLGANQSNRTISYVVDNNFPQISFVSPTTSSGNYSQSTIYSRISASDSSLSSVTINLYNSSGLYQTNLTSVSATSTTFSVNYLGLPEGIYYLNASATDGSNTNHTTTNIIILDRTAPNVFAILPVNATNFSSSSYNFSINATDTFSHRLSCGLYIDNVVNYVLKSTNLSVLNNTPFNLTATNLQNRSYSWYASCNDSSGNNANSTIRNFISDLIPPTINVVQPTQNSIAGQIVYISTEISDSISGIISARYDLLNQTNISQNISSGLLNSSSNWDAIWNSSSITNDLLNITLRIIANDSAGNSRQSYINFSVDNVNPVIQIISPSTGTYKSNFNLSIITQDSTLQYVSYNLTDSLNELKQFNSTLVSGTAHTFSDVILLTNLDDGSYQINSYANDSAGNSRSTSYNFTFDSSPPQIILNSPANETSTDENSILFNWTVIDYMSSSATCNLTLSDLVYGRDIAVTNGTPNTYLVTGITYSTRNWSLSCIDSAGNINASEMRTVTLGFEDSDNDGINDESDRINGNASNIDSSGFNSLSIEVNNSQNISSADGLNNVTIYEGLNPILSFGHNFTYSSLDLRNINLEIASNYIIVNLSGQLQADQLKTIYLNDSNFSDLCLEDYDISSISDISNSCDSLNEFNLSSCIGSSSTVFFGDIGCTDLGDLLRFDNLRYSAARGSSQSSESEEESENPASLINQVGSSSEVGKKTCDNNWICGSWSFCDADLMQSRTCKLFVENGCYPSNTPNRIRACPEILFDAIMEINNLIITSWSKISLSLDLTEVNQTELADILITYNILKGNEIIHHESETRAIAGKLIFDKTINPPYLSAGTYVLEATVKYGRNQEAVASQSFKVRKITGFLVTLIIILGLISYLSFVGRKKFSNLIIRSIRFLQFKFFKHKHFRWP